MWRPYNNHYKKRYENYANICLYLKDQSMKNHQGSGSSNEMQSQTPFITFFMGFAVYQMSTHHA